MYLQSNQTPRILKFYKNKALNRFEKICVNVIIPLSRLCSKKISRELLQTQPCSGKCTEPSHWMTNVLTSQMNLNLVNSAILSCKLQYNTRNQKVKSKLLWDFHLKVNSQKERHPARQLGMFFLLPIGESWSPLAHAAWQFKQFEQQHTKQWSRSEKCCPTSIAF